MKGRQGGVGSLFTTVRDRRLLFFENAIWKPIPSFPIGKELKQQISSLKRKQMVSPLLSEGDGGGCFIILTNEATSRSYPPIYLAYRLPLQVRQNQ